MSLRVLVLAPEAADLAALMSGRELDTIAPHHTTDVIAGTVTLERITDRVRNQHYDIAHFMGHMTAMGFRLSNNEWMKPEDMLQLMRHTRARMAFFNACLSTVPGQFLVDAGVPAALVHNKEVLDGDAVRLASYFYAELSSNNGDLRGAYYIVNPRDGTLSFLSNGNYQEQSTKAILAEIETLKSSALQGDARIMQLGQWLTRLAIFVGVDVFVSLLVALWFFVR